MMAKYGQLQRVTAKTQHIERPSTKEVVLDIGLVRTRINSTGRNVAAVLDLTQDLNYHICAQYC